MAPLVDEVAGAVAPRADKPFAFFGHSMGALVAFEVAHALRRGGKAEPLHLFVSACAAPHLQLDSRRHLRGLSAPELIRLVQALDSGRQEGLEDDGIIGRRLPLLRADLSVCETYAPREDTRLDCPLTTYGGIDDPIVSPADLEAWRDYTTGSCLGHVFRGDHFFLSGSGRLPMLRAFQRELEVLTDRHGSRAIDERATPG
jgi:surfactin synthase thioesterase subunit